jgi:hypothetical protein
MYSIQYYVIKFSMTYDRSVFFFSGTPVSSTNKTVCHNETEILLKVASNTITLILTMGILKCLKYLDRDEISTLYRGLSIDASSQVSVHLVKRFQRRRILKISQSETRVACGG